MSQERIHLENAKSPDDDVHDCRRRSDEFDGADMPFSMTLRYMPRNAGENSSSGTRAEEFTGSL